MKYYSREELGLMTPNDIESMVVTIGKEVIKPQGVTKQTPQDLLIIYKENINQIIEYQEQHQLLNGYIGENIEYKLPIIVLYSILKYTLMKRWVTVKERLQYLLLSKSLYQYIGTLIPEYSTLVITSQTWKTEDINRFIPTKLLPCNLYCPINHIVRLYTTVPYLVHLYRSVQENASQCGSLLKSIVYLTLRGGDYMPDINSPIYCHALTSLENVESIKFVKDVQPTLYKFLDKLPKLNKFNVENVDAYFPLWLAKRPNLQSLSFKPLSVASNIKILNLIKQIPSLTSLYVNAPTSYYCQTNVDLPPTLRKLKLNGHPLTPPQDWGFLERLSIETPSSRYAFVESLNTYRNITTLYIPDFFKTQWVKSIPQDTIKRVQDLFLQLDHVQNIVIRVNITGLKAQSIPRVYKVMFLTLIEDNKVTFTRDPNWMERFEKRLIQVQEQIPSPIHSKIVELLFMEHQRVKRLPTLRLNTSQIQLFTITKGIKEYLYETCCMTMNFNYENTLSMDIFKNTFYRHHHITELIIKESQLLQYHQLFNNNNSYNEQQYIFPNIKKLIILEENNNSNNQDYLHLNGIHPIEYMKQLQHIDYQAKQACFGYFTRQQQDYNNSLKSLNLDYVENYQGFVIPRFITHLKMRQNTESLPPTLLSLEVNDCTLLKSLQLNDCPLLESLTIHNEIKLLNKYTTLEEHNIMKYMMEIIPWETYQWLISTCTKLSTLTVIGAGAIQINASKPELLLDIVNQYLVSNYPTTQDCNTNQDITIQLSSNNNNLIFNAGYQHSTLSITFDIIRK